MIAIPDTAATGTFAIHASAPSGQAGSTNYQVTALAVVNVALSPTSGRAGSVVTVTGSGYRPGETVSIRWNGANGTLPGAVKANVNGRVSAMVTVPKSSAVRSYTIHLSGGTSKQVGTAAYTVTRLAIATPARRDTWANGSGQQWFVIRM